MDLIAIQTHKTMQQEENKKSNATELHDTGLENVFKEILKRYARKLKKQLQKNELEKTDYEINK